MAEWVADEVEQGRSVADVAQETGLSRATVRRMLAAIDLAEEIEAGEYDELVTEDVDAVFLGVDPQRGIGAATDLDNVQMEEA